MTQKLLLRATLLVCAMLLGMSLQAQVINQSTVFNPSGIKNPHVKFSSSVNCQGIDLTQTREQPQKATAKAESDLCTVTLNMEYDPEVVQAPFFAFLIDNNNLSGNYGMAFDNGEGALQGQVAPGNYDIIAVFSKMPHAVYYVIYEYQEVTGDMTLTLSPDLCINHITTKNYDPDGELLKHGIGHIDENNVFVTDQEGDIDCTSVNNILYYKGFGALDSYMCNFIGPMVDEETCTVPLDFYVTDVSDKYLFIQTRICKTPDLAKSYISYFSTDNVKAGILENDPNDYVSQTYAYKYSPYGANQIGYGIEDMIMTLDGKMPSASRMASMIDAEKPGDTYTYEVWANVPYVDAHLPELGIVLQTNFPDNGEVGTITVDDMTFETIDFTSWTLGPALRVRNGQKEFTNIGHHYRDPNFLRWNYLYGTLDEESGTIGLKLLPSPEAFTYPTEQALGIIGGNCPINAVRAQSYEQDGNMKYDIHDYFVGRYGESLCGEYGKNATLKYNCEEVDLETFVPENKGTFEWTSTYTNVEVDGLPGHNTTTVYFDQNQEDMTPPAVEMLHFRSEEGVTDRFATAADGTMEFYASDFNYQYYPDLWNGVFDCQPVEVTVEYAPYGTEEWNELAVEEIPEYYQEPGWGYFYRGSLAGVTGEGLNGWFDLRFRLQDASGNWMDQVVSPAFRIDDQAYSSVATVTADKGGDDAIYNLAGQRMRGGLNSMPHGIYIVGGKKVVK